MNVALPDAGVTDFAKLEVNFPKTDAKDRHVAAAAARCAPSTLVTWNVRDFNKAELAAHGIQISDPDTFPVPVIRRRPGSRFRRHSKGVRFSQEAAGTSDLEGVSRSPGPQQSAEEIRR
jgi:hypothetical protein